MAAGMLSMMASWRRLPSSSRPVLGAINRLGLVVAESNSNEVPVNKNINQRSSIRHHHAARKIFILQKGGACQEEGTESILLPAPALYYAPHHHNHHNRHNHQNQLRYFRTSAALFESKIVVVPPFADSVSEGDVRWEKKKGDSVAEDEVVLEIETDKTSVPVPAPGNGVIEEMFVEDGATVKAGQQLFKINITGEAPKKAAAAPKAAEAPAAAAAPPPPPSATPEKKPPASQKPPSPAPPKPKQPSSAAQSPRPTGSAKQQPGAAGGGRSKSPSPAPPAAKTKTSAPPPKSPPPGGKSKGAPPPPSPTKTSKGAPPSSPTKTSKSQPPAYISKQLACDEPKPKSKGAAPAPAPPTPKPAAAAAPKPPAAKGAPAAAIPVAAIRHAQAIEAATVKLPPSDPTKEITGTRSEQRVKMNRMRLKIAERLKEAQNTNAMLTTFNEIDMSHIMEFRKANLEAFNKKYGLKLGFMSAFCKASAYALQDQPVVNAVIDGTDVVYRDFVDISVAVATPKGLVVPVIRNVERMNFADIEMAMAQLGEKARSGKLAVEDMDGGTFTISNGGVFGSLLGTPIINPPQSSILGMHGIFERPIAVKGQVVVRPMMYVALTYDHRLIDGREAVMFLRKIKAAVEDPRIILAGL